MKKRVKQIMALTMASMMAFSAAGCGAQEKTKETAKETAKETTKETEKESVEKGRELTEPGTYPIVPDGEKMTLSCFTMGMPAVENLETNDFTKYLEDKTGIHIEWQTAGRDDWQEKLNMILSSGEYPDMIYAVSPDLAKFGAKEQIIIPLDDMINEENMPNYMERYGDKLDLSRESDGKIYSLLTENDCYHCNYGRKMWINTKYLKEMGLEKPTTTQEFLEMCKKYKEYKPDGIAVAGTASGQGWNAEFDNFLMGSFILPPTKSYTLNLYDKTAVTWDGDVVCVATDDRYREFLKYSNELYEAGALYDGNFTQSEEQMKSLINQPDAPVLCFTSGFKGNDIDVAANPELYAEYETLAPLKGPDGTQLATYFRYLSINPGAFCITDACENPEAALRWADYFYSEVGDLASQYGADEGKDWVLNPEGKFGLDGEPADYEILVPYSAETQNHDWQDVAIRVAPSEYRLGQAVEQDVDLQSAAGLEKMLYEETKTNYEPYGQNEENSDLDVLPRLTFTSDETTDVSTIAVEIEKIINESTVAFIIGTKDVHDDAAWEQYKASLEKAGLSTLLKTYQTAYDRQMK